VAVGVRKRSFFNHASPRGLLPSGPMGDLSAKRLVGRVGRNDDAVQRLRGARLLLNRGALPHAGVRSRSAAAQPAITRQRLHGSIERWGSRACGVGAVDAERIGLAVTRIVPGHEAAVSQKGEIAGVRRTSVTRIVGGEGHVVLVGARTGNGDSSVGNRSGLIAVCRRSVERDRRSLVGEAGIGNGAVREDRGPSYASTPLKVSSETAPS
jgi:hypothetical protein